MYSTIAIAYRLSTVSVAVSALEAAGFRVFCPGLNTITLLPHHSLAFGGVPIRVPSENAAEASEYLHAIQCGHLTSLATEDTIDEDPPEPVVKISFWGKAANLLGYLIFGVSAPWQELALSKKKASP
ncbi:MULTISPECIES: hypothetical protein [unclassified Leisingera]|uniref:hypothetical protein n=1 Tax=unclassified Leisingera TaxID=2614906 RepID=UPI00126A778C|nr:MULTISPECIES: hypothetical protein [unclassified Leisingera]